jgi:hypothetical protein
MYDTLKRLQVQIRRFTNVFTPYTYLLRYLVIRAAMGTGRDENIGKPSYLNLPPDIGFILFTPIKGRIDSLTVYIYICLVFISGALR